MTLAEAVGDGTGPTGVPREESVAGRFLDLSLTVTGIEGEAVFLKGGVDMHKLTVHSAQSSVSAVGWSHIQHPAPQPRLEA